MVTYTDAGFANLNDLGSQGGFITFITDNSLRNVLEWRSHKIDM